jgi:peroxiredoxin
MKKILLLALFALAGTINAQNELPKTALDIAPLLIGEKIPSITLITSDSKSIDLLDLVRKQKTLLVFYRGGWCPYCNAQLAALGQSEQELLVLGYQIIAVSPDAPAALKTTDEKEKLNYVLLSDSKGELSKAMGLAFQAPENYKPIITKGSEGVNTTFLPVPAVFFVGTNGLIQFEHITPDYKNRITPELLLAVAKSLQ